MERSNLNSTNKRILCIWLPDWPVLRQTLDRREPSDPTSPPPYCRRPIVLYKIVRGSKRVAACSAKARSLGITVDMPLSETTALVGDSCRGPSKPTPLGHSRPAAALAKEGLAAWPHDPRQDRQALERLAVWCHRYSPLVGLDDASEPDSLLLEVTGVARFFGGEEALAHRIHAQFSRRGIIACIGLAATVGTAWAAARFGNPAARVFSLPRQEAFPPIDPPPLLRPDSSSRLAPAPGLAVASQRSRSPPPTRPPVPRRA